MNIKWEWVKVLFTPWWSFLSYKIRSPWKYWISILFSNHYNVCILNYEQYNEFIWIFDYNIFDSFLNDQLCPPYLESLLIFVFYLQKLQMIWFVRNIVSQWLFWFLFYFCIFYIYLLHSIHKLNIFHAQVHLSHVLSNLTYTYYNNIH